MANKNWIAGAIKHPGALKAKYPKQAKGGFSNKELNSMLSHPHLDARTRKQIVLAKTLKGFHK